MKKTMKKLTALTLTLMLLFSLSAVHASAAGIFDKIYSAEFVTEPVITARELDQHLELMDEFDWVNNIYHFFPQLEVALTSGEVIEIIDGYGLSDDSKRMVEVDCYLDINDYKQAAANGESRIPFNYDVILYSSIGIEMDSVSLYGEVSLVDCYVKNIIPVSGLSDTYRESGMIGLIISEYLPEAEEYNLEGAVFDIEYPDGTVIRDTVSLVTDEGAYEYYELNGEEIWYTFDSQSSIVTIRYADALLEHPVEYIPFPISEIVIDEVKVTDDFEAESVSYTVTKADGTVQSYTYNFDSEPDVAVLGMEGYMAESVDGAYVVICIAEGYTEEYPSTEYIEVAVFADIDVMAIEQIEGATQEDNLLNRLIYKIRMFFMRIIEFLWYLY